MGRDLKLLALDELLTFKAHIVIRVFIPMLMLRIVFFGISSKPTQHNSIMMQMMNARYKRSGRPVFKTCIFSTICNNCRLRGKRDCRHVTEMPWSDEKQQAKIEAIMENYQADLNREIYNIDDVAEMRQTFDEEWLEALLESEEDLPAGERPPIIYTGVDPAAGGMRSKYAIVSVVPLEVPDENSGNTDYGDSGDVRHTIRYLVVGVDYDESGRTENYDDLLVEHIHKLRDNHMLCDAKVVIVPESNLALESRHIDEVLRNRLRIGYDYDIMYMDRSRVGLRMTNALKEAMVDTLSRKLSRGLIGIWRNLVCARDHRINGGGISRHIEADEARDELVNQMRSMRTIVEEPNDPTLKPTVKYSGKVDGGFDDLVDALMFTIMGHRYYVGDQPGAQAQRQLPI